MNLRRLPAVLVATLCLTLGLGHAVADVAIPPLKARITDLTGTLSPAQLGDIESSLRAFEAKKGSQIAVLVLPSTQPETIEQFSIRLAEAWKIGRAKTDDGVILVLAKNDRRLRIEVGYGLEGAIPDARAKRIVDEIITPRLREGDFNAGIRNGVEALQKLIDGEPLPEPVRANTPSGGRDYESLLILGLVVSTLIGGLLRAMLGRLLGATVTGGLVALGAWLMLGALLGGLVAGVIAFIFVLAFDGSRGLGGGWGGGGGGFSGGSSGGGFSGGGGSFGGGGASGQW
jgi:uncharacterized protein